MATECIRRKTNIVFILLVLMAKTVVEAEDVPPCPCFEKKENKTTQTYQAKCREMVECVDKSCHASYQKKMELFKKTDCDEDVLLAYSCKKLMVIGALVMLFEGMKTTSTLGTVTTSPKENATLNKLETCESAKSARPDLVKMMLVKECEIVADAIIKMICDGGKFSAEDEKKIEDLAKTIKAIKESRSAHKGSGHIVNGITIALFVMLRSLNSL